MESRAMEIKAAANKKIKMAIIPGHFATNHSHVNYYIDMTSIKTNHLMAKAAAGVLASSYMTGVYIDTIICLEGTEMVGAFIADELTQPGCGINSDKAINVITPETNSNNQMLFRDNLQKSIYNKRIMLLMASVSTGKTIQRSMECLKYYGGNLVGIASLFSAVPESESMVVASVFSQSDITDYKTERPSDCVLCKTGVRVDAIINSFGYSKI